MKIYTKKGDEGETSLIGGTRVLKDHVRIEAYGTIDELNAFIGQLIDFPETKPNRDFLQRIQNLLFTIGSGLAADPETSRMKLPELKESDIDALEKSMDLMENGLPELKNFILPGGHPAVSSAHICRCICRRAERKVVHLHSQAKVDSLILGYLNRLSDWFFVYGRELSQITETDETPWNHEA